MLSDLLADLRQRLILVGYRLRPIGWRAIGVLLWNAAVAVVAWDYARARWHLNWASAENRQYLLSLWLDDRPGVHGLTGDFVLYVVLAVFVASVGTLIVPWLRCEDVLPPYADVARRAGRGSALWCWRGIGRIRRSAGPRRRWREPVVVEVLPHAHPPTTVRVSAPNVAVARAIRAEPRPEPRTPRASRSTKAKKAKAAPPATAAEATAASPPACASPTAYTAVGDDDAKAEELAAELAADYDAFLVAWEDQGNDAPGGGGETKAH